MATKSREFFLNKPTSSLLACRGCLATDVRLYDMYKNRLMETYSILLGTFVQDIENLPHYFCSYCAALLLKCDKFRIKCMDSLIVLRNAQQKIDVSTEHIKIINRSTNFKRSELEKIDIVSKNPKSNKIFSDMSTDTDITSDSDSDISSDSDESNIDSTDESDCSVSERKVKLKAKSLIKDEIKIEYDIKRLLKKYIDKKGQNTGLLKDFEINLDCVESKSLSDIRKYKIKQMSDIINHIQYSSETSNELFNVMDDVFIEDTLKWDDNHSNTEVTKNIKEECKSNTKTKTLNKLKVVRNDKVQQKAHSKTALQQHKDGSNLDTSLIKIEEVKIEICLENPNELSETIDTGDDFAEDLKPKPTPKPKSKKQIVTTKKGAKKRGSDNIINGILKGRKTKHVKCSEELYATYNTEVKYLTKEEQIKVINDRRECNNYKKSQFKCNFCFKGFVIEETFKNHMLLHNDISGKFVCDICQCHFMNMRRLIRHKQGHKKVFTCKECGHTSRNGTLAAQHYRWHGGKKFSCKDCGKEFRNKSSQYGHIKMCHPTSEQLVRCEICGDSFNGLAGLQSHDNKTHKEMYSPECHCSVCETQFYCSDAFKAHRGTDGVCDTTHKYCVRCGESFDTEELLKEHEMEQQKLQSLFKCDVCHKTFKFFGKLKRHQWRHSTTYPKNIKQVKMYKKRSEMGEQSKGLICEICGKLMKNAALLKQHNNMVHSTVKPFKCTVCPKAFKTSALLVGHIRVHTGERPYQCTSCPKAFQNLQNLKRHHIVHTGERPHPCDICGKCFQTSSNLKDHIQTVHMKIPMPPRTRQRNKKNK